MATIGSCVRMFGGLIPVLVLAFVSSVLAQEKASDNGASAEKATAPGLSIGDVAPPISVAKWERGEPVAGFEAGHVYIVEFWATWCGPCRVGMPHISQLQDKHRDSATFIGVTREDEETVQSFMQKIQNQETEKTWSDVITYSIALDSNDETNTAYMKAAEQSGIPTAFVVGKDGIVEWIGHPARIDEPLAKILGDAWDRDAAAKEFVTAQAAKRARRELLMAMQAARKSGDWSNVTESVDKLILKNPDQQLFKTMKLDVLIMAKQYDEANAFADKLVEPVWDNAQTLNAIAWGLLTRVPATQQDHDLNLRIARGASELTGDQDGSILDTLARAHFVKGDRDAAIEWQKKAVAAAPDMAQLKKTLKEYESSE